MPALSPSGGQLHSLWMYITGVDPDIWYSLLIYNVTDEDNPTVFPRDYELRTQTWYAQS